MSARIRILSLLLFFPVFTLLVLYCLFEISKSRTFQFFGEIIHRVDTKEKLVALTFDDAPTMYTGEVLDILNANGVKATFYMIGSLLEEDPVSGNIIAYDGHELGNHSWSHERFYLKSQEFIQTEIEKTNALIRQTEYSGEITFRPPNGKKLFGLPLYLNKNRIKTVMWDVEPDTYLNKSGDVTKDKSFIVSFTLEKVRPGSIILLHPLCSSCTADRLALPEIIGALRAQGYTFVTVSELIASGPK